uniref:Phospholipase A2 n=1 Tax=Ampulex compressa TaxID=860918 RepID=A0A1W6EWD5_AMPCP|nr:phospholipase A2 -like protein 4 [Ampulex compressa]
MQATRLYHLSLILMLLSRCFRGFTIYPGTLWCGKGNRSRGDELGFFKGVDDCCRTHDRCGDQFEEGTWKYGLYNSNYYTRSECHCDLHFHMCLRYARPSGVARDVAKFYFNIIRPLCYFKLYDIPCMTRYYDNYNNSYKNSGGGKYFCAKWYKSPTWPG